MRKLALLLALSPALAVAAETASQALAALPPLPGAATPTLDCPAAATADKKVQAQVAPLKAMSMTAGASAVQPTPAQIQAMAAMSSPEFNECFSQLQVRPGDWEQALNDKLAAKLEQVNADYIKAIEAFCSKSNDPNCRGSAAIDRQFNQQAAAAGTQFLKDAQAPYGQLLAEVRSCVARREQGLGGAAGGGNNAMGMLFSSASAGTWGLINLPAVANTRLCEAAREAAKTYLPP